MDISSSSVKMVEMVDAGKGAIRVERYVIEPLAQEAVLDGNIANLEAVVEAVSRGWKKLATRTKNVAMALPASAVITKKIIVQAGLREEELEVQVETEANQYIPFALEEVNLDFQTVGPAPSSPEEQEVLIAATRKEKVEDRVAVAEASGLKATVMDVESYATQTALDLIKVASCPTMAPNRTSPLVDIGANVMNITVLRNDQSVYAREQAFGGIAADPGHHAPVRHEPGRGRGGQAFRRAAGEFRIRSVAALHGKRRARDSASHAILLYVHPLQLGRAHPAHGRNGGGARTG